MKTKWLSAMVIAAAIAVPAMAGPYSVYVGYADGLRGTGFFPSPWHGDPGITFIGTPPGAGSPDAGAIMIRNTGGAALTVSGVDVTINGTGLGDIWFGPSVAIAPGDALILTQTAFYNFDTSDIHVVPGAGPATPCLGLFTDPPACATTFPTVKVTTTGGSVVFGDTGHVLDTEGFDYASIGNESFEWRLIGTTGGPAAPTVPEPSTFGLIGAGLLLVVQGSRKLRS